MFNNYLRKLFGKQLIDLQLKVAQLEKQIKDYEEVLYHFIEIEQHNSEFKKMTIHAVSNLDTSLDKISQLSLSNHNRITLLEDLQKPLPKKNSEVVN